MHSVCLQAEGLAAMQKRWCSSAPGVPTSARQSVMDFPRRRGALELSESMKARPVTKCI